MYALLYRTLAPLFLSAWIGFALADPGESGRDWAQVGDSARAHGLPVVVVVTGADCGYCERLRREFLTDPATRVLLSERAVTREFDRESRGKITDFDGERLRARLFLSRYEIFATPTLLFLGPDGETLAPPLVGYNDPESYRELVGERLSLAQDAMLVASDRQSPVLATTAP
ncbi:MAG: thioredoxin fold domain-containing protein [Pseudomonadota bacterium]|nr:thioredoxin fold domain-containing protein [Pseudomonadota bacterium]